VTASAEGQSVCVQVRDAGAALTDDNRESAFTALGQVAAKTRSNSRYSRGMGLYCARLAASLCGAEIRVLSDASGSGNTFQLSLPQVQAG